jgi:hypothetical protein
MFLLDVAFFEKIDIGVVPQYKECVTGHDFHRRGRIELDIFAGFFNGDHDDIGFPPNVAFR